MTLADGTYELVPEPKSQQCEARINLTHVIKDLNQSSEEPKTSFAQEGKPRSITPTLNLCNFYLYMVLCIKFVGVD
jgi:hypothetical protein